MKKIALLVAVLFTTFNFAQAQTLDDLKAKKAEIEAAKEAVAASITPAIDSLDAEIAAVTTAMGAFPQWTKGFSGLLGADFAGSSNWYANPIENSNSRALNATFNAFAHLNHDKYFVKNDGNIALIIGSVINDDVDDTTGEAVESEELISTTSNFRLSNLSGYKLTEKLALSGEGVYETGIVGYDATEGKTIGVFNDPGQLTLSAGATWTPNANTTVYIHPIGYQWTFPGSEYSSSAGAKLGATYTGSIYKGIDWASNLNAFLAYSGDDDNGFTAGDLSNWTWVNTFTVANLFKGIGVGFTLGLRNNKQLVVAKGVADNPLQSYYALGLSYSLGN